MKKRKTGDVMELRDVLAKMKDDELPAPEAATLIESWLALMLGGILLSDAVVRLLEITEWHDAERAMAGIDLTRKVRGQCIRLDAFKQGRAARLARIAERRQRRQAANRVSDDTALPSS